MLASKCDRRTFDGVPDQENRQLAPTTTMMEDSHLHRTASEAPIDQRDAVSASMKPLFVDYLQQKSQEIADVLCSKYDYPSLATTVLVLDNQ